MIFGNWKKILKEKENIIEWYKKKEEEYRSDLNQKNKLLLQYQEKEREYLRHSDNTQQFQEIKQKVVEYEQRKAEYIEKLKNQQLLIEELKQKIVDYERKLNNVKNQFSAKPKQPAESPVSDGHYKTMAKIAHKQSSQQSPPAYPQKSGATMTRPPQGKHLHPSFSNTVQFNPFKQHGR